jgi:hypothetical protein
VNVRNQVSVYVRQVYGRPMVYPANEAAQKFADLLGVKTFAHRQLQGIEGLGFVVNQVADPAAAIAL